MLKRIVKWIGWTLIVLLVVAVGAYLVARSIASRAYHRQWTTHNASFPIPFPLTESEVAALRAERQAANPAAKDPLEGVDLDAMALARAVERGQRLVETRLSCSGCHSKDFGGLALIDETFVGYWAAPNLTAGEGSATKGYTAKDWDNAVRHGVRHNGESSSMPSSEFLNLSDHELSDTVAYIQSRPPVNRTMDGVRIGPVFAFLLAFDKSMFVAANMDHQKPHPVEPPAAAVTANFGEHITQVCRGCHGPNLSGGKIQGDPNMPIVANITPHTTGLQGWTEGDFLRSMREGKRKDGTAILDAMPWRTFGQMSDVELKAVWAYLETVPAVEKGSR